MSRQIIEKIFEGTITVETSAAGSTFSIFLPYTGYCRPEAAPSMPEKPA